MHSFSDSSLASGWSNESSIPKQAWLSSACKVNNKNILDFRSNLRQLFYPGRPRINIKIKRKTTLTTAYAIQLQNIQASTLIFPCNKPENTFIRKKKEKKETGGDKFTFAHNSPLCSCITHKTSFLKNLSPLS